MMVCRAYYHSQIGLMEIVSADQEILAVRFPDQLRETEAQEGIGETEESSILREALRQLDEYFTGRRREFDLQFSLQGSDFQRKVWNELLKIPYGKRATYKEVAMAIGDVKAARAVGGAANRNKLAIIVPCHRLIGTNGGLTGYAGGLWRKQWLLQLEREEGRASMEKDGGLL